MFRKKFTYKPSITKHFAAFVNNVAGRKWPSSIIKIKILK